MPFEEMMPLGDNNIEGRKDLGVPETLKVLKQTTRNVGELHNKLEKMHDNVGELHNEEEKVLREFEAIETELLEKLGDNFEGLSLIDATRVFKVSEKCPRHIISSDSLYLKTCEVIKKTDKSE